MKVMEGDVIRVRQSTLDACLAPLDAQGHRRNNAELWRQLNPEAFRGCLRAVGEWTTQRRRADSLQE